MNNKRLFVVTGKGGVGKTTISCALGLLFSSRNFKVLIASADRDNEYFSRILGQKVGYRVTKISDNLDAVVCDAVESMKEYISMTLKVGFLARFLLEKSPMKLFIPNIPGISEWAIAGKVTYHLLEKANGGYRYDKIVFDVPPTGHGMSLLKIPLYLRKIMNSGPMGRIVEERLELITRNPEVVGVIVTLPEEMCVTEALEILSMLKKELGFGNCIGVINKTLHRLFTLEEEELVKSLEADQSGFLKSAVFMIEGVNLQRKQIDRIKRKMRIIEIPYFNKPRLGMEDVAHISEILREIF